MNAQPRSTLSAADIAALHADLAHRLAAVGVETQPQVAIKLLRMYSKGDAGLNEYADVIRSDPALSGKLLRVANSAFFAQRRPVTTIERAAVILGLERIRAVSLGFYLSRAAATDPTQQLSRVTWGRSVFRACLCTTIARAVCRPVAAEAFVVGLMLDAGVPLMHRLLGEPYQNILDRRLAPTKAHSAEHSELPFTHTDVMTALAMLWKLPPLLAKPIELHHAQPAPRPDPTLVLDHVDVLHRIAYYVGAITIDAQGEVAEDAPLPRIADRCLGVDSSQLRDLVASAANEYSATIQLFGEFAEALKQLESVQDSAHRELVDVMESAVSADVRQSTRLLSQRFTVGDTQVEIQPEEAGDAVVYLIDAAGDRLASHRFDPATDDPTIVLDAVGVSPITEADIGDIRAYLRALAA